MDIEDKLIDEIRFASELAEKLNGENVEMHKSSKSEIMEALGNIVSSLSKPTVEVTTVDFQQLESLITKISLPDLSGINSSMEKILEVLQKKIEVKKEDKKPEEWIFDIIRHDGKNSPMKQVKAKSS